MLIDEQGGFGRFQAFAFVAIVLGINSMGWIQYDTYAPLRPKYKCWTEDGLGGITNTFTFKDDEC